MAAEACPRLDINKNDNILPAYTTSYILLLLTGNITPANCASLEAPSAAIPPVSAYFTYPPDSSSLRQVKSPTGRFDMCLYEQQLTTRKYKLTSAIGKLSVECR